MPRALGVLQLAPDASLTIAMAAQLIPLTEVRPVLPVSQSHLRIGGISLALTGGSLSTFSFENGLTAFMCPDPNADIETSVEWAEHLHTLRAEPVFDSNAVWKLFHCGQELVFDFFSSNLGSDPYKRLCTDPGFHSTQLLLNRSALEGLLPVSPLEYPADELLFTNYLAAHCLGVEVHGCGLVDSENGGHLFLGHSGDGKSTTARLWDTFREAEILSDDRLILRLHDGELWMYGTPWHGEAAFASAGRAKLKNIFILQHGTGNNFSPLKKARAVGEIFARCFPPFHSPGGIERTVEFLKRLVDAVPCYEFQFVPDQSAISAVLAFHA
ncbi:MAG TPA: hypothetical protein VJO35_12570 [Terriglobales bacterium]|nr:hypothetical protein [Terriglobales bacterium]